MWKPASGFSCRRILTSTLLQTWLAFNQNPSLGSELEDETNSYRELLDESLDEELIAPYRHRRSNSHYHPNTAFRPDGSLDTNTYSGREAYVFQYFKRPGFNDLQAAAAVGNLKGEGSNPVQNRYMDPTIWGGYKGHAFGIGQWLGKRRSRLFAYASRMGVDLRGPKRLLNRNSKPSWISSCLNRSRMNTGGYETSYGALGPSSKPRTLGLNLRNGLGGSMGRKESSTGHTTIGQDRLTKVETSKNPRCVSS